MKKKEYSLTEAADSNAFSLMDYTRRAMKEQGFSEDEIDETMKTAMSGDYMNLVVTLSSKIHLCNERASKK